MKPNFIAALLLALFLCGCYGSQRVSEEDYYRNIQAREDEYAYIRSGVCYMRADEYRWRRQSVEQMRDSRKIPSVDFEFDSIILAHSAYDTLDKIAAIMTADRKFKLIIEGHTDSVGTDDYNDWLSKSRANAIRAYLVSRDVYSDSITTYGLGKRKPLVNDDSPDGRACNRRVVFTLTTRHWATVY